MKSTEIKADIFDILAQVEFLTERKNKLLAELNKELKNENEAKKTEGKSGTVVEGGNT